VAIVVIEALAGTAGWPHAASVMTAAAVVRTAALVRIDASLHQ
jgi:hypothetical protein